MGGVAIAHDFDLRERVAYLAEVVASQLDVHGGGVFLHAIGLRRAGDGHDPRSLCEEPCERDLRRCRFLPRRDRPEEVDEPLVAPACFLREAWHDVAEVAFLERGASVDLAGEKTSSEGAEGDETDAELLARGKDLLFRLPPPERVFALERRDGLYRMR